MDAEEYQANLAFLWSFANLILDMPIETMLEDMIRAEELAPFLNPTLFIQKGQAAREDIVMLRAMNNVKRVIVEMREKKGRGE